MRLLDIPLSAIHRSVLADLRRQVVSASSNGFELLADEPFLADLRAALSDPAWLPFLRFLHRYVAGFAAFKFAWFYSGGGHPSWILLDESKPVPAPEVLLRLALYRAVLLRYDRLGVRRHFFNRRVRSERAIRAADQLLHRHRS